MAARALLLLPIRAINTLTVWRMQWPSGLHIGRCSLTFDMEIIIGWLDGRERTGTITETGHACLSSSLYIIAFGRDQMSAKKWNFLFVGSFYFRYPFYVKLFRQFWGCVPFWHLKLGLSINLSTLNIVSRFSNAQRFCVSLTSLSHKRCLSRHVSSNVLSPLQSKQQKKLRKMAPRLSDHQS